MWRLFVLILLFGCATTTFTSYVGDKNIYQGSGGALESVEGVDVWSRGLPNRKFFIVGFIDDSRPKGMTAVNRKKDLALLAKQHGAHGVILTDQNSVLVGYFKNGEINLTSNTASYSGLDTAIYRIETRALAINYED
ncbi:hypothetical protein [Plasticicumulans acidivorans]|uniref:hypothetical protein n=1 Tax=Plasticicumulans acidivorans TaxID=886464 RepID=UPI0011B57E3F|nr:hypothetical protein [Plasticicumulans acidivorans]